MTREYFKVGHLPDSGKWHLLEGDADKCRCGIRITAWDVVARVIEPRNGVVTSVNSAPCVFGLAPALSERSADGALKTGDRVEFTTADAAARYDDTGHCEWYFEQMGISQKDDRGRDIPVGQPGEPVARLRDKRTGVYVHAPMEWIRKFTIGAPAPTHDPEGIRLAAKRWGKWPNGRPYVEYLDSPRETKPVSTADLQLATIRAHLKASPFGWHEGRLLRSVSSTDAECIAWLQKLELIASGDE